MPIATKQSSRRAFSTGLLRRFAVRNDNPRRVIASKPPVIASGAKQSRVKALPGWIASPLRGSQ
ncbi:MAG: hypothetical protein LBT00_02475 [Spirochaetaceae bacterium]|nr:hypothetical protein [Spirochaetaceae bacterium]